MKYKYVIVSKEFAETHQMYQVDARAVTFTRLTLDIYVTDASMVEVFPEIFTEPSYQYIMLSESDFHNLETETYTADPSGDYNPNNWSPII